MANRTMQKSVLPTQLVLDLVAVEVVQVLEPGVEPGLLVVGAQVELEV